MTANFINPEGVFSNGRYTHVVEVTSGRIIYISGQVAMDASGNIVGENDMRAQHVQVMENLKLALAAVGADFSNVIKFNIYTTDIERFMEARDVRAVYIPQPPQPA